MPKLLTMIKNSLPGITPFVVGFTIWFGANLTDGSLATRLLLIGLLLIMLVLTFMAQKIHDNVLHDTVKMRWLLPLFVLSSAACSLFLANGTHRIILALAVIIMLFIALRKGALVDTADVVPSIAMATLFLSSYSLFAISTYIDLPRVLLVIISGIVAGFAAHDVFAHFHPQVGVRRLLVLSFSIVAMEFFMVLSLLPSTPLVGAALLSIPLASSFVIARALIRSQARQYFLRELILMLSGMLAVIVTARWV